MILGNKRLTDVVAVIFLNFNFNFLKAGRFSADNLNRFVLVEQSIKF